MQQFFGRKLSCWQQKHPYRSQSLARFLDPKCFIKLPRIQCFRSGFYLSLVKLEKKANGSEGSIFRAPVDFFWRIHRYFLFFRTNFARFLRYFSRFLDPFWTNFGYFLRFFRPILNNFLAIFRVFLTIFARFIGYFRVFLTHCAQIVGYFSRFSRRAKTCARRVKFWPRLNSILAKTWHLIQNVPNLKSDMIRALIQYPSRACNKTFSALIKTWRSVRVILYIFLPFLAAPLYLKNS